MRTATLDDSALRGLEARVQGRLIPRDDEANIRWVRACVEDMRAYSDGGRYLNFAGFQEKGDTMMRGAFGPQYERLVELKRNDGPTNLFRLNQNNAPVGG